MPDQTEQKLSFAAACDKERRVRPHVAALTLLVKTQAQRLHTCPRSTLLT